MKTIFSLVRGFLRSGVLVFRGSKKTTAIVFDKLALVGIIPAIGAAILMWIAYSVPATWSKYILLGLGSAIIISVFCAFNAVVITARAVSMTFHYSILFTKTNPIVDSGGCFSHDPIGGEILYTEPQLVVRGKLVVPIRLHTFFARRVANVLNEEILRVSGSDVPRAIVTSSAPAAFSNQRR